MPDRHERAHAICEEAGWPTEWLQEHDELDRYLILQQLHLIGERATVLAGDLREAAHLAADDMWEGWLPESCWDLDAPPDHAPYDALVLSGTWAHADHPGGTDRD